MGDKGRSWGWGVKEAKRQKGCRHVDFNCSLVTRTVERKIYNTIDTDLSTHLNKKPIKRQNSSPATENTK